MLKKDKIIKKFRKKSTFATLIFLISFLLFFMFIPFSNQSFISKKLDSIGMHELAFALDLKMNPSSKSVLSLLSKEKNTECQDVWLFLNQQKLSSLNNFSFTQNLSIKSISKPQETINYNQNLNLDFVNLKIENKIEMDSYGKVSKDLFSFFNFNIEEKGGDFFSLNTTQTLSYKTTFIDFENINYSDNKDLKNDLGSYYFTNNISQDDYDTARQISHYVRSVLKTEPSNIITNETGEFGTSLFCDLIKDPKIGDVKEYEFANNQKITARKIELNNSEKAIDDLLEKQPELVDMILTDPKLREFVKINKDFEPKFFNLPLSFSSPKDFKEYDENIDGVLDTILEKHTLSQEAGDAIVESTNLKDLEVYLNSVDGSLQGLKVNFDIYFTKEFIEKSDFADFLNQGLSVEYQIYNIYHNNSPKINYDDKKSQNLDVFFKDLEILFSK